jgi:hypothetical protein
MQYSDNNSFLGQLLWLQMLKGKTTGATKWIFSQACAAILYMTLQFKINEKEHNLLSCLNPVLSCRLLDPPGTSNLKAFYQLSHVASLTFDQLYY